MSIATIKQAIKTRLDTLAPEALGYVAITDIRKDPLAGDHPAFPACYLMPPSVESEVSDNRTNVRTYTFDILVLFNADNLTSTTQLEEVIETMLDLFDNDPTFGGAAMAGALPVSGAPVPYQQGSSGKTFIMVVIELQAKELVPLSFAT